MEFLQYAKVCKRKDRENGTRLYVKNKRFSSFTYKTDTPSKCSFANHRGRELPEGRGKNGLNLLSGTGDIIVQFSEREKKKKDIANSCNTDSMSSIRPTFLLTLPECQTTSTHRVDFT